MSQVGFPGKQTLRKILGLRRLVWYVFGVLTYGRKGKEAELDREEAGL